MPNFGVGARFQKDYYGFDLSANLASIVFINSSSLKGMVLFYPQPKKRHQLYFGLGPGIGYHLISVPIGGPFGGGSIEYGNVTLEGILGYELRLSRHLKTFIQLELSQPIYSFCNSADRCSYKPGAAVTGGFGF